VQGDKLDTLKRDTPQELSLLATNVLRLRKELGWSTRAFAEQAGISRSFLARVEQGSLGTVSLATVERLAKGFGVHPAMLMARPGATKLQTSEQRLSTVVASGVLSRRRRAGWTQGELATRAGVGRSHLAEIEAGGQNASLDVLARLADALGCSLWVLLADEDA
jgi:transcriptional regulator with XRE-family HTH domain